MDSLEISSLYFIGNSVRLAFFYTCLSKATYKQNNASRTSCFKGQDTTPPSSRWGNPFSNARERGDSREVIGGRRKQEVWEWKGPQVRIRTLVEVCPIGYRLQTLVLVVALCLDLYSLV